VPGTCVPDLAGLRFRAVRSDDVGDAYRLAATGGARGAFNVAAEPVLDPPGLARILEAQTVRLPAAALRAAASITWRLHLQPTPPGWVDLALGVPILDTTRARTELGWTPRHGADDAIRELLAGLRDG